MPDTTTRFGINTPQGIEAPDTDAAYKEIADKIDSQGAMFGQGTFLAMPTSTPGSPGKQGRFYMVTSGAEIGELYYDYGTGWIHVNPTTPPDEINIADTFVNRPDADEVAPGTKFFATDQVAEYISNGVTWTRISSPPAGAFLLWPGAAAPAGWVIYDGSAWPSLTGIYAEAVGVAGGPNKPNWKGLVPVGLDAAQAEFDTLGETGGSKTNSHTHTYSGSTGNYQGTLWDSYATAVSAPKYAVTDHSHAYSGTTSGPSITNILQPYKVCHYIGKL